MNLSNIFTSGFSLDVKEYELKLKYILFNSLLLINIPLVSIAALFRFSNAEYTQAIFDLVYIILGISTFFLARKSKKYFSIATILIITYSFFIVAFPYYAGLNPVAGISWFIVLLMTTFFLSGNKAGSVIFLLSLIVIIFASIDKYNFNSSQITLGVIPFFIALVFMYFFERRNQNFKKQLLELNQALTLDNNKLTSEINTSNSELLKLQEVLDKSPVSIIITDIDAKIEYANPWFSKLTGYSLEEATGHNPKILKSNLHADKYYMKLWGDITNKKVWNGTFKNIKKDGSEYWESAIIAPVSNDDGVLTNYIAIKQEITKEIHLKDKLALKEREKEENFEKTLESFVRMVEERDTYTGGHSERVAKYSLLIAKEMNFSEVECKLIYRAAILHDIGKIATPDNVLLKPGKLTNLEYTLIKEHVNASYEILARIPMYKDLADIIICHHEHYDGSGYPNGLKGDEMSLLSQIMIVADAFDAMTTNRIYKGRKNLEEAIDELKACSGTQFNPEIILEAVKALKDVELEKTITQLPKSDLEQERFSYFYRDQTTLAYNADYLMFMLNQNQDTKELICINILYMHNFNKYNAQHGWSSGDNLLNEFSKYLVDNYPDANLFRIYGDDFVLIHKEHVDINMTQLSNIKLLSENNISITQRHIDLREHNITEVNELIEIKD